MADSSDNTACACDSSVKQRLLAAAEQLFADNGFDATTVRDIAAAADCNVASVNYYFGGKMNLYEEMWREQLRDLRDVRLDSIEEVMNRSGEQVALEQLLKSFANSFLGPWVDEEKARRLMKLMAREMVDSRLPMEMFSEDVISPTIGAMQQALMKICPGLDEKQVPLIVFSIAGQLLHVIRLKGMFDHPPHADCYKFDLANAVDHIVKFSAGGIRAYIGDQGE